MRFFLRLFLILSVVLNFCSCNSPGKEKDPVDYVNPYMGNISHLLVPTFPTVHLPNSMLRFIPNKESYTSEQMYGIPLVTTSHRSPSSFRISPFRMVGDSVCLKGYSYDNEKVEPYRYVVRFDEEEVDIDYAPSHQSAVCHFHFEDNNGNLVFTAVNGELEVSGDTVRGYEILRDGKTKVFIYLETKEMPARVGIVRKNNKVDYTRTKYSGRDASVILCFGTPDIHIRYGISYISGEQAQKNMQREIDTYDTGVIARRGRDIWNNALGKIKVQGDNENDKVVFYTSLYRIYERMVNISEDGKYYSGFDKKVHEDEGIPFYTDDWVWDTYRAVHPLRILIEPEKQAWMIRSFIRMARQTPEGWMPTFPEVTGDSHRMNGNHVVSVIADALCKDLTGFDVSQAYKACKSALSEKSHLPWLRIPKTELDDFFTRNGYFPGLNIGETEFVKEVDSWERRQSVAISLGAYYDYWCLSRIARKLGMKDDVNDFLINSQGYRKLYNKETAFFHPRNNKGDFIEGVDYKFSGGLGARDYYDENNAWTYRWAVPHNIADMVSLMGGNEKFVGNLDRTFREPLGKPKYEFYAQLPDQTGNVGQFSMGNEPSLHIPYLYNYAKQPWRTQKKIHRLLDQWFRNDLMGMPGDEDGGGMSAFVVFSSLGFYPVTPGLPMYAIGSPRFERSLIKLGNGKTFEIICEHYASENKYIQSARLDGKVWNKSWFSHKDIMRGGKLELVMGKYPNKAWASDDSSVPPSFEMEDE